MNSIQRKNTNDDSIRINKHDVLKSCLKSTSEASSRLRLDDSSFGEKDKNQLSSVKFYIINDRVLIRIVPNSPTPRQPLQLLKTSSDMAKTLPDAKLQSTQDQSDDEDGGPKPKSRSTIVKIIPQQQPTLQSSKTSSTNPIVSEEEDEDGSFRPKQEKEQKAKTQAKKNDSKKKQKSALLEDFADEDGAMSKPKNKVKETKTKKGSMFVQCFHRPNEDDSSSLQKKPIKKKSLDAGHIASEEDEDGGRTVKTHSTIKKIILLKQPTLNESKTTDDSPAEPSVETQNSKSKGTTDPDAVPTPTAHSSPSANQIVFLRTKSYQVAQQYSPPIVLPRPDNFLARRAQSETNEIVQMGIDHLVALIRHSHSAKKQQKRNKRARNRWHLAYSLIHNPWLFNHRANYLKKLRAEQNNQLKKQSPTTANDAQSETLRARRLKDKTGNSFEAQPPIVLRVLPIPSIDDNTQDSIEQNIPVKLPPPKQASSTAVAQQENVHSSVVSKKTPSNRHVQKRHPNE